MAETTITIPIDTDIARIYSTASAEVQKKIQLLLRLRLRELIEIPDRSLEEIMNDIGAKAEARGMTPEILETLLREE